MKLALLQARDLIRDTRYIDAYDLLGKMLDALVKDENEKTKKKKLKRR